MSRILVVPKLKETLENPVPVAPVDPVPPVAKINFNATFGFPPFLKYRYYMNKKLFLIGQA